jgi:uncharacterized protein (TIGR02265 family)
MARPSAAPGPRVRLEITASEPLVGELDLESSLWAIPASHSIKGMFFRRCVGDLGERFAVLAGRLEAPPALAGYLTFTDYPMSDYFRIFVEAARSRYDGISAREAVRRYAREEITSFRATVLGRVTWSLLEGPAAALLRYPETFGVLAQGPRAEARQTDPSTVVVELRGALGPVEYALGVLEGLVLSFSKHPRSTIEATRDAARIEVRWS